MLESKACRATLTIGILIFLGARVASVWAVEARSSAVTLQQAAEATQPTQAKCAPAGSDPSNVVEAQSAQATSGEMCEPEFTGFCHCGCGAEPDCNTDADCGGGSTCDEFISCC